MLKNKNFDVCLIGKSYLSYMMGLHLMGHSLRVLMVDDHRISYGSGWSLHFGELEKKFLQIWGDAYDCPPLAHLDNYLRPGPTHLILGGPKIRIRVGGTPERNLQEIRRKFPSLLPDISETAAPRGEFNEQMDEFTWKVAGSMFEEGAAPQFVSHSFPALRDLYRDFSQNSSELKGNLLYLCQAFFQGKMAEFLSENQLYHLLVSLLTPRYVLDENRLIQDIHKILVERGGPTKKTLVESFQIHQGRLVHLQLKSFEGVIRPGNTWFMGGPLPDLPLRMKNSHSTYSSLVLDLTAPRPVFKEMVGERILSSPAEKMGTEIPFWEIQFGDENFCRCTLAFPKNEGDILNFYFDRAQERVFSTIAELCPFFDPKEAGVTINLRLGREFWVKTLKTFPSDGSPGEILDGSGPAHLQENPLKGTSYLGPLQGHDLGLFSYLTHLHHAGKNDSLASREGPL